MCIMLQSAECLAQAAEAACVFAKPNRWTSGKFRLTSLTGLHFQSTMEYGKERKKTNGEGGDCMAYSAPKKTSFCAIWAERCGAWAER